MSEVAPVEGSYSKTWTFFRGRWSEGNVAIMGPRTHAAWLGSAVFDGARRFERTMPDLDMHCARVNRSAELLGLDPVVPVARWLELVDEGVERFDPDMALYIRPMYWPRTGVGGGVKFDASSTDWCLCLYEAPMPGTDGVSVTLSPFRKPGPDAAPTLAKASCLYPNNARALAEAASRGFGNALMLDADGRVAELANANVFIARSGVALTPEPNGTFLDGITRRRVISLLRADGIEVLERRLSVEDVLEADEIFSCGNFQKVAPVVRIEGRALGQGPIYRRARALYWDYAHGRVGPG